MRKLLFFLLLLFTLNVQAQNARADSLLHAFREQRQTLHGFAGDTTSLTTLAELMWELRVAGNYKAALGYADTGYAIINARMPSLKTEQEKQTLARKRRKIQNYVALVYRHQGRYPEALDLYFSLLKESETQRDSFNAAMIYNNMGNVYLAQNNRTEGRACYEKAIAIARVHHYAEIASVYDNLGIMYAEENKFDSALVYMNEGLQYNLSQGYKPFIASSYNNLGTVCFAKKDYEGALKNFNRSLQIKLESGDSTRLPSAYRSISEVYMEQKKYALAEDNLRKAEAVARRVGEREALMQVYKSLAQLHEATGDYRAALKEYRLSDAYHDTLLNEENTQKSMRAKMQFDFDKKAAADSIANAEAQKVKDAELAARDSQLKQATTVRYALFGGIVLALIFGGFMFNRFSVTRKQKAIIEQQKSVVEEQKEIVEEKNKEILDSINYAQRIQSAILPVASELEQLFPDAFVLYRPKDIVSGDFYWIANKGDDVFIAVADCTGHGVPGGFMSMLGTSLLNEVVLEKNTQEPGEILDLLRVKIILALKQKGESGENKDGMDMVLCRVNRKKNLLSFAAANNPLWVLRNGTMEEWKADKQPVGIHTGAQQLFTQHEIVLQSGDCVYLFTDGFADQFGGPKGKKYKYKQLQETIAANAALPMKEQSNRLAQSFLDWKGNLEQVDDVCVIGIRIG